MISKILASGAVIAGLVGGSAGAASAATHPAAAPKVAIGSVELAGPLQYESFLAIRNAPYHGQVDYTNWTYAEPGSGVWAPVAGSHALVFTSAGTAYDHTVNGGMKLVAKSPTRLVFSGSGGYDAQAGATWAISGQVNGHKIQFTITYDGTLSPGYSVTATGTIATDGSASGTAQSSQDQSLTWTMPAGSWFSVLHYIAPVTSAQVQRQAHKATFQFTIPSSVPGLAGTRVTVKVHDGGHGTARDTYAHGVTGGPLTQYPIIGGPGITIR